MSHSESLWDEQPVNASLARLLLSAEGAHDYVRGAPEVAAGYKERRSFAMPRGFMGMTTHGTTRPTPHASHPHERTRARNDDQRRKVHPPLHVLP